MPPDGIWCSACGYQLGDPQEDLHDPDGLSDVAQSIGGPVENKDSAHLIVRDGEKGWRYYCDDLGQVAKIVDTPPEDKASGEGEGQPPSTQESQPKQRQPKQSNQTVEEVYELEEDKSQMDILQEVVTNPLFGLNDGQVNEIKDWANDYDGRLPPQELEAILKNFSGIQKQTATLARNKYETKLNKWIRESSQSNDDPQIGVSAPSPSPRNTSNQQARPQKRPNPKPKPDERRKRKSKPQPDPADRMGRRKRRVKRRQDIADKIAERAAEQAADDIARELTGVMSTYVGLPAKILEAKIEKDPDWAIEKAEQFDIDIDTLMEPSQTRKDQMEEDNSPTVDLEADEALESIKDTPDKDTPKPNNEPPREDEEEEPVFDEEPEGQQEKEDEEDGFNEIFGGEN